MKIINVHPNFQTLVDDEDYEYLNQWKWHVKTNSKGKVESVRRTKRIGPRKENKSISIRMHRLIMSVPDNMVVDHINGNPLDNRKCNLRICTKQQNLMNLKPRADKVTSKYKGVCFDKARNKFMARISINGKHITIGRFNFEIDAAKAYNQKAKELHGEFARLNIIEED